MAEDEVKTDTVEPEGETNMATADVPADTSIDATAETSSEAPVEAPVQVAAEAPAEPVARPAATQSPTMAAGHEEKSAFHVEHHTHFKWHADVLIDGHELFYGYIKDVSAQGANLFLDHNMQSVRQIKLRMHVPPLRIGEVVRVVETTAKIVSSVYDGAEEYFRAGIIFSKFVSDSDRAYLLGRVE